MGRPVKVLLLLVVVYGSVLLVASFGYHQDWKRIAAYNIVMREVCHECDVLCPRAPYPTSDEERAVSHFRLFLFDIVLVSPM